MVPGLKIGKPNIKLITMSLVRFKTSPVEKSFDHMLRNIFTDDFDNYFVKPFGTKATPAVNTVEGKDNFRLEFAVPGFSKDAFNVKLDGKVLTITGEKKNEVNKEDEKFTMREFTHQSFSRSFTLPETVDSSKIAAEYADGILKVVLPKKEEEKQKTMDIKVA